MNADVYQTISIVGFACAGVLFIIGVFLFIKFDIPALVLELSGKTAEKQVREIREQNKRMVSHQRNGQLLKKQTPKREQNNVLKEETMISPQTQESWEEGTEVLEEGTEVLEEETVLLEEGTEVLEERTVLLEEDRPGFKILQDEIEIHTSDKI